MSKKCEEWVTTLTHDFNHSVLVKLDDMWIWIHSFWTLFKKFYFKNYFVFSLLVKKQYNYYDKHQKKQAGYQKEEFSFTKACRLCLSTCRKSLQCVYLKRKVSFDCFEADKYKAKVHENSEIALNPAKKILLNLRINRLDFEYLK